MRNKINQTGRIHIILGTKAQLIKMMPIMVELQQHGIPYNFIDTGQHSNITKTLRRDFGLPDPDFFLTSKEKNITGLLQALLWSGFIIIRSFFQKKKIFDGPDGVCLVHGDTMSTLLGLLLAKIGRQRVAHIEAGERTGNLLQPFPEEIIRIIVDKFTDFAFSSSEVSHKNLLKENIKGQLIPLTQNTIVDAIRVAADQKSVTIDVPEKYILVSIHRFETLRSKDRMQIIVDTVQHLAQQFDIVWGLHEPTKNYLEKYDLLQSLVNNHRIHLRALWDYFPFIRAMKLSQFLITDGGGPQEESHYLGVPCMLMRTETEREQHPNVFITRFKKEKIAYFVENVNLFRKKSMHQHYSPSKTIVDFLEKQSIQNSAILQT